MAMRAYLLALAAGLAGVEPSETAGGARGKSCCSSSAGTGLTCMACDTEPEEDLGAEGSEES